MVSWMHVLWLIPITVFATLILVTLFSDKIEPKCTVDRWQECKSLFCSNCELPDRVERAEGDSKALREWVKTLKQSNAQLGGRVWRKMS